MRKTTRTAFLIFAIILTSVAAMAQTTEFTFQGKLTDGGAPPSTPRDFEFRLFDAATLGTQLGSTQQLFGVNVNGGVFTVTLNFGAQFTGAPRWLEIAVKNAPGPFTVLTPRQPITSSPYSSKSDTSTNFTGNLAGDVTGNQGATTVAAVGGQTAVSVANAATSVAAASSASTANTLVRRNATGGFSAGFIVADTASINGQLDLNDFVIANIGDPSTDFTATGGLNLAGNLSVTGTSTGDASVVLPSSSVSAAETLNEPGVASATSNGGVTLDGTVQTLLSRNISVPSAGFVLVIGTLQVQSAHLSGTLTTAAFGVSDTAASFPANQDVGYQITTNAPSGTYQSPITVHGLFSVVAGLNTFYLLGEENGGEGSVNDMQLTLLFVPTSYGTVTSTFAEPASGKSVEKLLKTAENPAAEKAVTPKVIPDANTPKQLKAEIDELKKIVCTLKSDAEICKQTNK